MPSTPEEPAPPGGGSAPGRTAAEGGRVVRVADEGALADLARRLAASLPARACLALEGDLGAGKTTFVKAVAAAVGIDPADVTSPTFGLVHVHEVPPTSGARRPARLVHADAYRLADAREIASVGWEEFASGPGWLVVEWPGRIESALPKERLTITIDVTGESTRRLTAVSSATRFDAVVDALADAKLW